jgi:hypothetical protein
MSHRNNKATPEHRTGDAPRRGPLREALYAKRDYSFFRLDAFFGVNVNV